MVHARGDLDGAVAYCTTATADGAAGGAADGAPATPDGASDGATTTAECVDEDELAERLHAVRPPVYPRRQSRRHLGDSAPALPAQLLEVLWSPPPIADASHAHACFECALRVLDRHVAHLSLPRVISLAPSDAPLRALGPYLRAAMPRALHERHDAQVMSTGASRHDDARRYHRDSGWFDRNLAGAGAPWPRARSPGTMHSAGAPVARASNRRFQRPRMRRLGCADRRCRVRRISKRHPRTARLDQRGRRNVPEDRPRLWRAAR